MSIIHIGHIKSALEKQFCGLIDMKDSKDRPQQDQLDVFLTRSLAAYSLVVKAGLDPTVSAGQVTDGFDDNGLDAVYFDEDELIVYIVQSKWNSKGQGSPARADILKFIRGFRDLITANFARFNVKLRAHQASILKALYDPNVRFELVLIHTGLQGLSQLAEQDLSDLRTEMNDTSEVVTYAVLSQKDIHRAVAGQAEGDPVDIELFLQEWGQVREPYQAIYGQVEVTRIAELCATYGNKLLTRNLRKFIGNTAVNKAIAETLLSEPHNFWYFNNGITILCNRVTKAPVGGSERASGLFKCEGISVVNGAQTVGAIGNAYNAGPLGLAQARVTVRLISLEHCPEDFASAVTRATNTQNRIESRDFVSLDPEQARLYMELNLSNLAYAYKTGETDPSADKGCSVVEATVALACADADLGLAVQAKREISKLWEDIEKPPYKRIFNSSVTGVRVWRAVEILRIAEKALERQKASSSGLAQMVAIHGNRFILHRVFRNITKSALEDPVIDFEPFKKQARMATARELKAVVIAAEEKFPDSYMASLFKNLTKCNDLCTYIDARAATK